MKRIPKSFAAVLFLIFTVLILSHCTNKDKELVPPTTQEQFSTTELLSLKVTTAPTIDGTIDPAWDKAQKLKVTPTVPDPGNNLFTGYNGKTYPATLRSMYDNQYIYFIVEVPDRDKNLKGSSWYFNPATQRWAQEPNSKSFDENGVLIREGFGIDQFAMLWNIDNSTPKFITQTCYASCHIFTPYFDYSKDPAIFTPNASGNHYTNGKSEKIDMWWAHPARGFAFGNMDDEYQDWAGGPEITNLTGGNANGRHFDDLVVSGKSTTWPYRTNYTSDNTQGSINNRDSFKLDGNLSKVAAPLWVIPNSTSDYIKATDTLAGGIAVKITGVSSTGVLTYAGGTIDPNVGTDYQRTGNAVTGPTAVKGIPGVIISPVLRGRADIAMAAVYGTVSSSNGPVPGWIYEIKRLLKTGDLLKQDVDFSSLQDQPFGMAIFNNSNNQHGIKPNLLLKFQQ